MRRWVSRIFLALGLLLIVAFVLGRWWMERQVAPALHAASAGTEVRDDADGIATIRGGSWLEVVESQGALVASQRMFQMDLIRRFTGGRLAELFGATAIDVDVRRRLEDRDGV